MCGVLVLPREFFPRGQWRRDKESSVIGGVFRKEIKQFNNLRIREINTNFTLFFFKCPCLKSLVRTLSMNDVIEVLYDAKISLFL